MFHNLYKCSKGRKLNPHSLCFSRLIVLFQIWFSLCFVCFISRSQAVWCSYGNACRMCVSGSGPQWLGGVPHWGARRKMTSKNLKTEHIYFSDSNDFVWKRVNTITLTTELGGFEGLTLHCFPRERVRTAEDHGEGPEEPGGFVCFHFLLRNAFA